MRHERKNRVKKVAIYTIQTNNYGNRLQNYAVQEVCNKLGYEAVSLGNSDPTRGLIVLKKFPFLVNAIKTTRNLVRSIIKNDAICKFYKFNQYIKYSTDYISNESYRISNYYAILVGSDQVWNTQFKWISENAFLPFYHPKKISFAASFGVDHIEKSDKIAACLNDFSALSVREEAGREIIKELTGKNAAVIVDPTLLLSQQEWRKIERKPKGAEKGYILTYFLSSMNEKAKNLLEKEKGNYRIYNLLDKNDLIAGKAGPSEFLWLFDNADLILTDSFHASVFSFLFDKPFVVFDRNWSEGNMNSRLVTLLSKLGLERKYAGSGMSNDIWEHDYAQSYKRLETEQKKALNFLKAALEAEQGEI